MPKDPINCEYKDMNGRVCGREAEFVATAPLRGRTSDESDLFDPP